MKKIIAGCIAATIALLCAQCASAQNRSINFAPDDITVEDMFAQAKAGGKIIFMDCYASWCGPCKMMARDVFTVDRVADFFNENFFCVKFDMEKGEGARLNKTYGVSAYPTFLFIDPNTRLLVHTMVGGRPADEFIAGAKEALNPDLSMDKARAAYESGEKTPETVGNYLTVLSKAHLSGVMNDVAVNYLAGKSKEELADPDNWAILCRGVYDIYSEPMQTIFTNRDYFNTVLGEQEVVRKTGAVLSIAAREYTHSKAVGPDAAFDAEGFAKMKAFLENSGDPSAVSLLLQMKATEANQNADYGTVIDCLYEDLNNNVVGEMGRQFFRASNVARLTQIPVDAEALRTRALAYFDDAFALAADDLDRANILRMKGIILKQWGCDAESDAAMQESMVWARKNAEARGRK